MLRSILADWRARLNEAEKMIRAGERLNFEHCEARRDLQRQLHAAIQLYGYLELPRRGRLSIHPVKLISSPKELKKN